MESPEFSHDFCHFPSFSSHLCFITLSLWVQAQPSLCKKSTPPPSPPPPRQKKERRRGKKERKEIHSLLMEYIHNWEGECGEKSFPGVHSLLLPSLLCFPSFLSSHHLPLSIASVFYPNPKTPLSYWGVWSLGKGDKGGFSLFPPKQPQITYCSWDSPFPGNSLGYR